MNPAQDAMKAMQDQTLEAIKQGQAATLDAVKQWNATVSQFAPQNPAAEVPAELKDAMGNPQQILDNVFGFASQLLELNRKFAQDLLASSAPAEGKDTDK